MLMLYKSIDGADCYRLGSDEKQDELMCKKWPQLGYCSLVHISIIEIMLDNLDGLCTGRSGKYSHTSFPLKTADVDTDPDTIAPSPRRLEVSAKVAKC
jgi:hypothetical protein